MGKVAELEETVLNMYGAENARLGMPRSHVRVPAVRNSHAHGGSSGSGGGGGGGASSGPTIRSLLGHTPGRVAHAQAVVDGMQAATSPAAAGRARGLRLNGDGASPAYRIVSQAAPATPNTATRDVAAAFQ